MNAWLRVSTFVLLLLITVSSVQAEKIIRTWKDKSGKFEVEAELLRFEDNIAHLLKKDGRAISVPLIALSEPDQKFLRDYSTKVLDPFAGGTPLLSSTPAAMKSNDSASTAGLSLLTDDSNVTELPTDGEIVFVKSDEPVDKLAADPSVDGPQFKPFLRAIEPFDAYARVSMPIIIDPASGTYALSAHRKSNAVADNEFGRIFLISSKSKSKKIALESKATVKLVDHHTASGRSLVLVDVGDGTERGGDLVLLEQLASGKPGALHRWHLPEYQKPGFKPKVEFGKLLNATQALVQVNDTIYLWDLTTGENVFKIDDVRSGSKIRTSGQLKYLAIPTSGGCQLVDIAKQELVGKVAFPSTLTPELHFSPSGTRLAMTAGNQYLIWDLVNAKVDSEATISNPCGDFYGWIGEDYLLTSLGGLIDPKIGMGLWSYSVPTGKMAITIQGGIVALDKDYKMSTLVSLPVPHKAVEGIKKKLSGGDNALMVVRPGTEVALAVEAIDGVDTNEIKTGLQLAVEKAGWKVVEKSPIIVKAVIARGKKQTLRFRTLGQSILSAGEEVKITPYTAKLTVTKGKDLLWSRFSQNMVPFILHMEKGETLKQAVKKFEKADPGYFERLVFPPKILKPELSDSVGRSTIKEGSWSDYFPSDYR